MQQFRFLYLFTLFIIIADSLQAQDIEALSWKKGVTATGGIGLNNVFYTGNDSFNRRDPYAYYLTGQLNVNAFGLNLPFSFSFSNTSRGYTQPFNQFRLAPKYKWVQAYLGTTNMSFSEYTLAGHTIWGAGVELTPGNWRVSAVGGRLKKAVPYQVDKQNLYDAAFERWGYGLKVGYDNNGEGFDLNLFTAKDRDKSIDPVPVESGLHPMQNLAMGLGGRKKFFKHFLVEAEYSLSVLNSDIRIDPNGQVDTVSTKSNFVSGLLPSNSSNSYFDAFSASAGYQSELWGLLVRYQRVAPGYYTLGGYYFNDDMENYTLVPSLRLMQGKLTFSGNVGYQYNNLDGSRASNTKRFVGSGSANWAPNEKWNASFSYSNFSTYTNMRPQTDPYFRDELDSLNFYQVSNSYASNLSYTFGSEQVKNMLMLNLSYQKASDRSNTEGQSNQSDFVNALASYSRMYPSLATTLTLGANVNSCKSGDIETFYWGPNLSAGKGFLKNTLTTALACAYNQTRANGVSTSPVMSTTLNVTFTPKSADEKQKSRHNLLLSLNLLNRLKTDAVRKKGYELTGNLTYNYSF